MLLYSHNYSECLNAAFCTLNCCCSANMLLALRLHTKSTEWEEQETSPHLNKLLLLLYQIQTNKRLVKVAESTYNGGSYI